MISDLIVSAKWVDIVGSLAAILTTISFFPQAWHSFKTKDVSGVSLGMYSVFTVGVALWRDALLPRQARAVVEHRQVLRAETLLPPVAHHVA